MKEARARAAREEPAAGPALVEYLPRLLELAPVSDPVVSGYLAIGDEIDPADLMAALTESGTTVALPVMVEPEQPLEFRGWRPGEALVERMWGIREPGPDCPVVIPDLLLVPLLGVDDQGNRLGYGGGFYDRTLAGLRSRKTIAAVGLAYEAQRLDAVPHGPYDEPLDYVLTPTGLIRCPNSE